jgi:uncharacterized membrane protein
VVLKIILSVCFIPIPVIIYLIVLNEAKPKKNIILGVTLPLAARGDPSVSAVVRKYVTLQSVALAVILLLASPLIFIQSHAVLMTWYFIWLIAALALPAALYIRGNGNLKALKMQNGWFGESTGLVLVDVGLALIPQKTLNIRLFIPPVVFSLAPVVHAVLTLRGSDEFWPLMLVYLTFAVMTVGFYFLYRIVFHQKADVVENTPVNAALTQVRRYNWGKCWLFVTWLTGLYSLAVWLSGRSGLVISAASVLYTIILLVFFMNAEFKTRKIQQRLTAESGRSVYADDDDHWMFGILYNNPKDRHFIVNRRTGIGATINVAMPAGKALIAFTLLLILSLPFIGLLMIRTETTPVTLAVTDAEIVASHGRPAYEIFLDDIQSVNLLSELPNGIRTNGIGLDTLYKGRFSFDGIGPCSVCLNPQTPPFIAITTAEDTYILGASGEAQTLEIYTLLAGRHVTADAA